MSIYDNYVFPSGKTSACYEIKCRYTFMSIYTNFVNAKVRRFHDLAGLNQMKFSKNIINIISKINP